MEVVSFLSNKIEFLEFFREFVNSYPTIKLSTIDIDTAFYTTDKTGSNEIYFHFVLDQLTIKELSEYNEEERFIINKYFTGCSIYFFDIQYRNETFFKQFVQNFTEFISPKDNCKVVMHHPFEGLLILK